MIHAMIREIADPVAWPMIKAPIPAAGGLETKSIRCGIRTMFFEARDIDFTPSVLDLSGRVVDWLKSRKEELTNDDRKLLFELEEILLRVFSKGDAPLCELASLARPRTHSIRIGTDLNCQKILSYSDEKDLGKCRMVSKSWEASADLLFSPPACAFGKEKWARYIGDVGVEPQLPKNIHNILNSPCPIWRSCKVYQTHMLVLIPSHVDGVPLTLESLDEFVKKPKEGNATRYQYIFVGKHLTAPAPESHWVLMTKYLLPSSWGANFEVHQALIRSLAERSQAPYQIPNALDVVTGLFMEYIHSKKIYLGYDSHLFTRCHEMVGRCSVNVGGFEASDRGLCVSGYLGHINGNLVDEFAFAGIVALRKF